MQRGHTSLMSSVGSDPFRIRIESSIVLIWSGVYLKSANKAPINEPPFLILLLKKAKLSNLGLHKNQIQQVGYP